MNKVALIGRWTKDLELSVTQGNGTSVAKGTIAINRKFKKEGQPEADFLPVVIWGKQAESTAKYCGQKGNQLSIVGRLETSIYTNKDGVKVYKTEVVAEEIDFLNSKKDGQVSGQYNTNTGDDNSFGSTSDITPIDDGDIPF